MNKLVLSFLGLFLLSSCTEQIRARNFGGSTTVDRTKMQCCASKWTMEGRL